MQHDPRRTAMTARTVVLGMAAAFLLSGCETIYPTGRQEEQRYEAARIEMARQQSARELAVLRAQSEAAAQNISQLDARLGRVEQQMRQGDGTRAEVEALRREIGQLRAEREQLRAQIVGDLSKEMMKLVGTSAPAAGSRSGGAGSRATSGWEHKVEPGQTLSDIAKAYKTTVSAITRANNLKDDRIRVGQVLFIPD